MQKLISFLRKAFFLVSFSPMFVFGASNDIFTKIQQQATEQITEAGVASAEVAKTVIITFGIIYIVVFLTGMAFKPEAISQNIKLLVGIGALIGIAYGIASAI